MTPSELIFVTHNAHKVYEIQPFFNGSSWNLLSLTQIGFNDEILETAPTIEGNAILKAQTVFNHTGFNCFADDTGLEVEALNNEPGVYSARYAGQPYNSDRNIDLLLKRLQPHKNRNARFKTIICLYFNGQMVNFEGIVEGEIAKERSGNDGFGYDPVFVPKGYNITFAQMGLEQKNAISHRAQAVKKLIQYLQDQGLLI